MMQSRFDLHCHSSASDGVFSPTRIVEYAAGKGLVALALTDHDTTSGLEEALAAAEHNSVTVYPGVEISCLHQNKEVHILGLFIDPLSESLSALLASSRRSRDATISKALTRLSDLGIPLTERDIRRFASGETIGRAHIARAMVEHGFVDSTKQAFEKFLGEGRPARVFRPRPSVFDACSAIHRAGGISSLAHPGGEPGLLSQESVIKMVDMGLNAIEVYHPSHDQRTTSRLLRWCRSLNLLPTGGSDFHGPKEGADIGACGINESILEELKGWRSAR